MKATIEALGYCVVGTAGDGLTGAEMVISRNPKLVILDYGMPIMDGLASLRAFRQQRPDTRVIVVSAGLTETAEYWDSSAKASRRYWSSPCSSTC